MVEGLDPVGPPSAEKEQGVSIRIHIVGVPDDRHQTVNGFPHIGIAGNQEQL